MLKQRFRAIHAKVRPAAPWDDGELEAQDLPAAPVLPDPVGMLDDVAQDGPGDRWRLEIDELRVTMTMLMPVIVGWRS